MTRSRHPRRGVTLVEMLVATAMCILGMWMLTWMFQQATASFSLANAQATLTAQERMVTTVLTRDLEANKFPEDERFISAGTRGQRLGDYYGSPPRGGYFLARAGMVDNVNNFFEAADTYGFASARAGNHYLQFTAIRPDEPGNRFSASCAVGNVTPRSTAGTAVEVAYYLVPTGQTGSGTRLHDLMRVQRLVAHTTYDATDYVRNVLTPWYGGGDVAHEVMVSSPANAAAVPPKPIQMHTLRDLSAAIGPTFPRFTDAATRTARNSTSLRFGEDRLLSNVLSFEVKFTGQMVTVWAPNPPAWPTDLTSPNVWPRPFPGNSDYPYDFLPFDGVFDTATSEARIGAAPGTPTRQPIRITGVQIRIRALSGTNARQTTIIVAL